jgi:PAS domain S-box-containing protein
MAETKKRVLDGLYARITITAVAVGAAFLLHQTLAHYFTVVAPFITFSPAVMIVALLAGFWPGLLATLVSSLLVSYWIFKPIGSFAVARNSDAVALAFFVGMGVFMSVVAERYRRNQRRIADAEKQQQSEEQFAALANTMPQLCWMANPDGSIFWYNERWYEYTGTTPEQMEGWGWQSVHDPDTLPNVLERWKDSITTGKPLDMVFPLRGAGGVFHPFLTRVVPVKDAGGKVVRWFGTNTDISEQKEIEVALRKSKARLDLAIEVASLGEWELDLKGNIGSCSSRYAQILGYPSLEQKWSYARFLDHLLPQHRAEVDEMLKAARVDGAWDYETQIQRLDGAVRWIWVRGRSSLDEMGQPTRAFGTVMDITERKEAEEARIESELRYRSLFDNNIDAVFLTVPDGRITAANPSACAMFGMTEEELCRAGRQGVSDPTDTQLARAREERSVKGSYKGELSYVRKDGTKFIGDVSTVILPGNEPTSFVIVRDMTVRKQEEHKRTVLEQQLHQAQKMEAVGQLAGGIAHDFNNLIMVVQSYAEMLQDSLPPHDALRNNTREIMKAAARGASLTGQMLAFSRKQVIFPVVLDLNAAIKETAKMLTRVIGEDIEFRVVSAESLWAIKADPDQIAQILMNLCVNSRDAMPQGGTLTVATGNVTVQEGSVCGPAGVSPGDYVRLSITDSGTGISKELQEQIFEPFFTTKEVGKGTGLGLATVYGIVKQSGGYLWVDSELGQGACFTIYLPKVERPITPKASAETETNPRGTETLLVVEDEEFIRAAICEFLRSLGYTVFAASSGQEALLVASQQEHIDLLLTDVVMPQMSGRELSQMLGILRPDLKTIHMSGYTDDAVLRHGVLDLSTRFLQKPFSLGTLARKVRDTLRTGTSVQS